MELSLIYITCPTIEEAQAIAETLVVEKLVACTNVIPAMLSTFMWQGELTNSEEVLLLAKTKSAHFERVRQRVRSLHSYTTPAIVALPIQMADADYLKWIENEVE